MSNEIAVLLADLESYAVAMAPGAPKTDRQILDNQLRLRNRMRSILMIQDGKTLADAIRATIEIFERHKEGAFSTPCLFRGRQNINLSTAERIAFEGWLNVFVIMATPEIRSSLLKQVSLERSFSTLPSDQKTRVISILRALVGVTVID